MGTERIPSSLGIQLLQISDEDFSVLGGSSGGVSREASSRFSGAEASLASIGVSRPPVINSLWSKPAFPIKNRIVAPDKTLPSDPNSAAVLRGERQFEIISPQPPLQLDI